MCYGHHPYHRLTFNGKDKQPRKSSTNKPALSTGTQTRKTLGSLPRPSIRLTREEMANKLAILEQDLTTYQLRHGPSFLRDKRIRKLANLRDKLRFVMDRMDGDGGVIDANGTIAMREAPFDIPVIADEGATVIERHVRVVKAASSGSASSGYYAQLFPTDLAAYGQLSSSGTKIKRITSYSLGSEEARVAIQTHQSDELLGASVSNYTRIGSGFCGVTTDYPMGDFPLYLLNETGDILGHNVGSASGLKVIFDVILEILI